MRSSSHTLSRLLSTWVLVTAMTPAFSEETVDKIAAKTARVNDNAAWRELFAKDDFDRLEAIGQELMTSKSKYSNGRSRFDLFLGTGYLRDEGQATGEDFQAAIGKLEVWLKAKPNSIVARLMLAETWSTYGWLARGDGYAATVNDEAMRLFRERNRTAAGYLDEVAEKSPQVDCIYRSVRIDVNRALGVPPDQELVYDGLKDDPWNKEMIDQMSHCLLPRWYGEPGDLEIFADQVVQRTKSVCGETHYATVAISVKGVLWIELLDTHAFDWKRLQQAFQDFKRQYPHDRQHLNHLAQFALMAHDRDAVYELIDQLGDDANEDTWNNFGVPWRNLKIRMSKEALQGDQQRLIATHLAPVDSLNVLGDGEYLVSVNRYAGIQFHELASGERIGHRSIRSLRAGTSRIHPQSKLLAAGSWDDPGVVRLNLETGEVDEIPTSDQKVWAVAFSSAGDLLAAADELGMISVVTLKTGKVTKKFSPEPSTPVQALSFSPDGKRLVAATQSGELVVFDLKAGRSEGSFKFSRHPLPCVAWSGSYLAAGTTSGGVAIIEWPSKKEIAAWGVQQVPVISLAFSAKGDKLAIGVAHSDPNAPVEEAAFVWNYQSEPVPKPLRGHRLGVNRVCFGKDDSTVITGSHDWTIRVWNVP